MEEYFINDNSLISESGVKWSSEVNAIIDADEKEFEIENNDFAISLNTSKTECDPSKFDMSWGNYFAKKSPPMGDLTGSGQRPLFQSNNNTNNNNNSNANRNGRGLQLKDLANVDEGNEDEADVCDDDDDVDRDVCDNNDVKLSLESNNNNGNGNKLSSGSDHDIIINKSEHFLKNEDLRSLNNHYSTDNRDSNSTTQSTKTNMSDYSNKKICISKLEHIQRFYQFSVTNSVINNANSEKEIEPIILDYIQSIDQKQTKAILSAITYNAQTNQCTVLILFEYSNNSDSNENDWNWIEHFLSFPAIARLINTNHAIGPPTFTQLSSH